MYTLINSHHKNENILSNLCFELQDLEHMEEVHRMS